MRFFRVLLAAMLVNVCPAIVDAQTEPSADVIRANNRNAVGAAPENERVVSRIARAGVTGSNTYLRFGKDTRSDSQFGPIHRANGIADGVPWRQNENGLTITHVDEPAEPLYEAMTTSIEHVAEPKETYIVSRLSALGRGTKAYYDAATWYEVRFDRITATETVTTTYGDFHTTGGFVRPWHVSLTDGHPEDESTTTITSDDVGVVDAASVAVPKDARALVEFPAGKDSVQLPAHFDALLQKFVVRVKIGDRGLDFVLDSGAGSIVLENGVARQLGLADVETYSSAVNAGRYTGGRSVVPRLDIGDLVMHDVVVATTPELEQPQSDTKIVGLLGFDFLRSVGATLDYDAGTVTVTKPQAFVAPASARTIVLDVRLGHLVPQTSLTINGAIGSRFTLDTGGFGPLLITNNFKRLHPEAVVDEGKAPVAYGLSGIGGRFPVDSITLKSIALGTAQFEDVGAFVVKNDAYGADADGIIGPPILEAYTVVFDLTHSKVYLVPPQPNPNPARF